MYPWSIIIEIDGNPYTAYEQIRKAYEQTSGLNFEGKFIDQQIQESFEAQQRMAKIVSIFAGIAILISLLGLLAMSTYFIQQRSQKWQSVKYSVRTIKASCYAWSVPSLIYVVVAFVIATPIIWYAMNQWLSDYSYRIDLNPLIFIVSGLFCLVISFAAVFVQSFRAANANPVNSIANK